MRLNKYIADSGFCSRREADRLVGEGRVTVNGVRARIGAELGEGDKVLIDGNPLAVRTAAKGQRRHVYIALNKPVGITSTTESDVKGNIVDLVDHQQRRHRQPDPARGEQAGKGVPGRGQPPGDAGIPACHGPRRGADPR